MSTSKVEIQGGSGNVYYPKTSIDSVIYSDNTSIEEKIRMLETKLNELKSRLVDSINDKTGSSLTSNSTVDEMAAIINSIKTLEQATADANATASNILVDKTAYVNGAKVTGIMPNHGTVTKQLAINETFTLDEGHINSLTVTQNILLMNPNWNDKWETHEYTVGAHMYDNGTNYALLKVPNGHYINGCNWVGAYTPDLRPENIVAGKNVLGVNGSATIESLGGKYYKTGTSTCTKSGNEFRTNIAQYLSFTPRIIVGHVNTSIGVRYFYWNNIPDEKVLLYYADAFNEYARYAVITTKELNASSVMVFSSGSEYTNDVHWIAIS